jgi:hypothetical protein
MWSAAFSSDECEVFSRALDQAWHRLSETGHSKDETLEKAALSRGILKAAGLGERSVEILSAYAVAHLEDNKYEVRAQRKAGAAALRDGN